MVYLVHHADAVAADVDAQRPLSASGRAHAARLAALAAANGAKPHVIWHSGKLRARQTAEAFRSACNPLADFAAMRGLQPADPPQMAKDLITGESRDVMLVGHMPNLERVHELLLQARDAARASFPPHGVVAIQEEGASWREVWRLE